MRIVSYINTVSESLEINDIYEFAKNASQKNNKVYLIPEQSVGRKIHNDIDVDPQGIVVVVELNETEETPSIKEVVKALEKDMGL